MSSILALPASGPRPGDARDRVRGARPDLPPDASAFRAALVLLGNVGLAVLPAIAARSW